MVINVEQQDSVAIIRPVGYVDAVTAGALADALNGQLRAGNARLVVDLGQLDYMSSAGLRVLLASLKEARRQAGDLRLANAKAEVSQVLEMSGFSKILQVYGTVAEAVASYETATA
jgi:anti-sigma B factor antagonist